MSHSSQDNPGIAHDAPPGKFPVKTAVAVVVLAAAAFGVAIIPHEKKEREAVEFTDLTAVPTVSVTHADAGSAETPLVLPASVNAFIDAPVYARTDGYLIERKVDIGSRVKAGDLLAEIDAPEIDAQLVAARAALEQARANARLAEITVKRIDSLKGTNAVSVQDIDNATGDVAAKRAALAVAEAEVVRLAQLVSFRRITAPFDGVITERNTDLGDLIASGIASKRPLFRIAGMDTLRVFVNVPEAYAGEVRVGDDATVAFTATPGVSPVGKIVRTAGAIDPESRTMLVEIRLPNADGKLLPGGYARVTLKVKDAKPKPIVPINTLLYRNEAIEVGVVNADNVVELKKVTVGRNFGIKVELDSGITTEDRIIVNPSDSLLAGGKVAIAEPAAKSVPTPGGK